MAGLIIEQDDRDPISIVKAVSTELFKRNPKRLTVMQIPKWLDPNKGVSVSADIAMDELLLIVTSMGYKIRCQLEHEMFL